MTKIGSIPPKINKAVRTALICSTLFLGACGGGDVKTTNLNTTTTIGQELMDLQKSFEAGIINEKEFDRARKGILERYDN